MKRFIKNFAIYLVIFAVVLGVAFFYKGADGAKKTAEVKFSTFATHLEKGKYKTINITDRKMTATLKNGNKEYAYAPSVVEISWLENSYVFPQVKSGKLKLSSDPPQSSVNFFSLLPTIIMVVALGFLFYFMMSQGGNNKAFQFGKNRAKLYKENGKNIRFADVAGLKEEKEELEEIVDFLKNPSKYSNLGARIPKGVLLVGNPGTGKTYISRATAGEAGVPFFTISGSDFVEMFVGVGASRVRDMFEQAKKNAPCLIFIDEIDAVGRQRGAGLGGGHDEREQTLNQMLVEMDGFGGNEGVIVIAATNRPDVLDPALTRPGRFDRQVVVGLPDVKGREQILKVHMRKVPVADDVDAMTLARGTPGYSGADLANLVNEAALFAARSNKRTVSMLEFEKAKDKINMGPERRTMIMTDKQKESTAYHEAGHAIVGYLVPEHDPVHKVTIIPRGRALGVTFFLPEGDQISISQKQLESKLSTLYAGRLAEDLIYGEENISTGASNDIKVATNIARNMVTQWGFSDKLGPILYTEDEGEVFLGRSMAKAKHMSDETAHAIDEEVRAIVNRNYARARQILIDNMDILHAMKDALVKYETIEEEQIKQLMNREPVTPPSGWEDNKDTKPTAKPQEEKTESEVNHSEDPEE